MTGRIDITCSLPAPTLAQVRAWLTRTGWEVDTSPLAQALDNERWSHPVHGRAWVPREELVDWLPYVSNWIANRAWQIEATPEAVYREIVGPGAAEARIAELEAKLAKVRRVMSDGGGCEWGCRDTTAESGCMSCRLRAVDP